MRRLLDVGGGSGVYSIAFARASTALRAEILDLPTVLPIAEGHVAAAGLADRVTARALARGGRVVVSDFVLDEDGTAPRQAVLFSINMLVGTPSGRSYRESEYASWLSAAGLAGGVPAAAVRSSATRRPSRSSGRPDSRPWPGCRPRHGRGTAAVVD